MSAFQTNSGITLQGLQQPESLGDMVSRFAQLRALSQNMQSQRLRDEETNLRLTELRRLSGEEAAAKQDRDLLQQIWMEKGGDEEATFAEAVKRGVRMETVNTLKTAHAKRMTELIKLDDAQRDRLRKRNQDISAAIFPLTQIPETPEGDAQLVQLATQTLQGLAQQGLLSAEEAQQYTPILQQPPAEIRKTLGFLAMAGISADKQYEAATQAAKRNELTAGEKDFQAFYKSWLEANNLEKNAKNELAAREAFREQKRTPVPGVDVPLPADVEAQKTRMAAAAVRISKNMDTAGDIADYADAVASGQMEITAVPMKVRGAVVSAVKESGRLIVSAKEREGIQALDIPLGIIADIEKYADKINTEQGVAARTSGVVRSMKSYFGHDADVTALKSKIGTLALLIRALGEKGTLAEGDVSRAIALIPTVTDTKTEKDNKIRDLKQILSSAKAVKTKGAAQTFGAGGQPQAAPAQAGALPPGWDAGRRKP